MTTTAQPVVSIAGVSGAVEDFSLRRTTLRDLDGVVHTVPNGEIRVASNLTRVWSRINQDVTVAYGTDIDKAIEVVDNVGREMAGDPVWKRRVLEAPRVERVQSLEPNGVTLKILGTVRAPDQWSAAGDLRKQDLLHVLDVHLAFGHHPLAHLFVNAAHAFNVFSIELAPVLAHGGIEFFLRRLRQVGTKIDTARLDHVGDEIGDQGSCRFLFLLRPLVERLPECWIDLDVHASDATLDVRRLDRRRGLRRLRLRCLPGFAVFTDTLANWRFVAS